MFEYKRLDLLLLKNTIMTISPMVLILIVILGGMSYFNVLKNLECERIDTLQPLESTFDNDIHNVELTLDRADRLGYDYYLDGQKRGSYYYSFMDDTCVILLIDSDEEVLFNYTVRGRVKLDNTLYHYILEQCAKNMNMTTEQLQNFTYDYVISEVEYPELLNNIIRIAVIFMIVLTVFFVLQGVMWTWMPWRNPQIRNIHGMKIDPKRIVIDINRQIYEASRFRQDNVIVTKRYLIVSSLFRTDIVRLRDIEIVSKHMERKRSFPWIHAKEVYKLIISNSGDLFYEYEFADETLVDTIIPLLNRKKQSPF